MCLKRPTAQVIKIGKDYEQKRKCKLVMKKMEDSQPNF